jgi:hypothetical protein
MLRRRAHEESDYDVGVFLRDMPDRIAELYRLADHSASRRRSRPPSKIMTFTPILACRPKFC